MWLRLKLLAAAATTVFVAIVAAWFRGRASKAQELKAKQTQARLDAMRAAREVEDEVDSLDDDELRKRATRWVRDDD